MGIDIHRRYITYKYRRTTDFFNADLALLDLSCRKLTEKNRQRRLGIGLDSQTINCARDGEQIIKGSNLKEALPSFVKKRKDAWKQEENLEYTPDFDEFIIGSYSSKNLLDDPLIIMDLVTTLKAEFPEKPITLSYGENTDVVPNDLWIRLKEIGISSISYNMNEDFSDSNTKQLFRKNVNRNMKNAFDCGLKTIANI